MNSPEHTKVERPYGLKYIVRKLTVVCIGLIAVLFFIQTAKLATVGRMGGEISGLENMESEVKMENEVLRSKISELRASDKIQAELEKEQELRRVEVKIIPEVSNSDKSVIASQ